MENKTKAILMIVLLLTSMLFISGCVEQPRIKSKDDVSNVVTNASTNIENVQSTLEDIDRSLSGTGP